MAGVKHYDCRATRLEDPQDLSDAALRVLGMVEHSVTVDDVNAGVRERQMPAIRLERQPASRLDVVKKAEL
jgi:hypothetical protein